MIRRIPKAFVDVAVEHRYEADCYVIRCRRTGFRYMLTREELIEKGNSPSFSNLGAWLRSEILPRIFLVPKK